MFKLSGSSILLWSVLAYASPWLGAASPVASSVREHHDVAMDVANYSFEQFLLDHGKSYSSHQEYVRRKTVFEKNLELIMHQNQRSETNYKFGINAFADLEEVELPMGFDKTQSHRYQESRGASLLNAKLQNSLDSNSRFRMPFPAEEMLSKNALPESVDWRTNSPNIISPIKNQGGCGSCWAFAATAALESHIALLTGKLFVLSVQEYVSCASNPQQCGGSGGCGGSTAELAYAFTAAHGITDEWSFSYASGHGASVNCTILNDGSANKNNKNGIDNFQPNLNVSPYVRRRGLVDDSAASSDATAHDASAGSSRNYVDGVVASIVGFANIATNDYDALMNAVARVGPVVVNVAASKWGLYSGGIFDDDDTEDRVVNHAVVLEGYGTDEVTGVDYWLVRNSWGPIWGEDGYIRLKRVDPSSLEDPDSDCRMDTRPADGTSCTKDEDGNDVQPRDVKVCGTSAILFDGVIPLGGHLI